MQLHTLPSGSVSSVPLPEGLAMATKPTFSCDDASLAFGLRIGTSPGTIVFSVMAVSLAAAPHSVQHTTMEGQGVDFSLDWAPAGSKLCVGMHCQGERSGMWRYWVLDDKLALLASIQAMHAPMPRVLWNASASGLLIKSVVFSNYLEAAGCMAKADNWHWCGLPEAASKAPVVPNRIDGIDGAYWGAHLVGAGEVMLTSRKAQGRCESGRLLTCSLPSRQSTGVWDLVELGHLLSLPDATLWLARGRYVALTNAREGLLQLHLLQPGPRLELQHSMSTARACFGLAFSWDARYLLFLNQESSFGALTPPPQTLVVLHVRSLRWAAVALHGGALEATWMPAGICVRFKSHCVLLAFSK